MTLYERPKEIPICDDVSNLQPENIERDGKWFCNVCDNEFEDGPEYDQERIDSKLSLSEGMKECRDNCARDSSCIGFFFQR